MAVQDMPGASPWTQRLLSVYGALVLIFLMLPTVIVIPMFLIRSIWSFRLLVGLCVGIGSILALLLG